MEADLFPLVANMMTAVGFDEVMHEITWICLNISSTESKDILDHILDPKYQLIEYL